MPVVRSALLGLVLGGLLATPAAAAGCSSCFFGGTCIVDDQLVTCGPTQAGCVPNAGILVFNSVPPNVPAYWTLFAKRRRPGRLQGRLEVFADEEFGDPAVPGFPGVCEDGICFGRRGRFNGTVVGDEFTAVARYRGGGRCEFRGTLQFGFGGPTPNAFTCRTAGGILLSEGAFHLQGIRLQGCAP
jgi:hypothetical protein